LSARRGCRADIGRSDADHSLRISDFTGQEFRHGGGLQGWHEFPALVVGQTEGAASKIDAELPPG
jgi:hypothetical protein